jgi:enoyl-CoA hydratase/carnithine racemase
MFNGDLMSEPTVRFHTIPLNKAEGVLGVAVMDRPKALNALDHVMIRELLQVVETVESDPNIKALWIESSAEKAFCVGGDVRDVTDNGQAGGLTDLTNSADYLADEYLLDVSLRYCSKPVFAWGDGYIMGGGMGVFQGADIRCVTEHSNLAMPEVRIGFVPDCGGSWFLNRVPNGLGICLAMSGSTVAAADACWLNLADWLLPRAEKPALFEAVLGLTYSSKEAALSEIGAILFEATSESPTQGPWEQNGARLSNSIRHQSPRAVWQTMQQWHHEFPELFVGLEQASPGAVLVAGYQHLRAKYQNLSKAVLQEHDLGMRLLSDGEWCEGVRALLIDKDKNPQWRFKTVEEVTPDWIQAMLAPMEWPTTHPLEAKLSSKGLLHD